MGFSASWRQEGLNTTYLNLLLCHVMFRRHLCRCSRNLWRRYRHMQVSWTLPQTRGLHPTTSHSLWLQCTWRMREKHYPYHLMLLRLWEWVTCIPQYFGPIWQTAAVTYQHNVAHEFTKVLEHFGVADKVSTFLFNKDKHLPLKDLEHDMWQHIHEWCNDGQARVHVSTFWGTSDKGAVHPTCWELSVEVYNQTIQHTMQTRGWRSQAACPCRGPECWGLWDNQHDQHRSQWPQRWQLGRWDHTHEHARLGQPRAKYSTS